LRGARIRTMARTRQIKPEFFLDDELASCTRAWGRLLFIGLWTLADREGRLEDRPAKIKAQLFPYDDEISYQKVDALLNELSSQIDIEKKYIIRYQINGRKYIQIRSFTKHQRCHIKESPSTIPAPTKDGAHLPSTNLGECEHQPRCPASTSTSTSTSNTSIAAPQASPPGDSPRIRNDKTSERPKDEAYELFASEFAKRRSTPYRPKKADWVQLADLRKSLNLTGRATPDRWTDAVDNYLWTPSGKYSLADLCVRFDVFLQGPLDRYGKPAGAGRQSEDMFWNNLEKKLG